MNGPVVRIYGVPVKCGMRIVENHERVKCGMLHAE